VASLKFSSQSIERVEERLYEAEWRIETAKNEQISPFSVDNDV
jgi:hypothetical protein